MTEDDPASYEEASEGLPDTAGSDARTQYASSGAAGRKARLVERSCLMCHRRKVRCDKKMPCSTCKRNGVLCCYPDGDKPAPRQPKTTIADIATRLVQLERTIVALSSNDTSNMSTADESVSDVQGTGEDWRHRDSAEPNAKLPFRSVLDDISKQSHLHSQGLLVHDRAGLPSRYVNEVLLSRVLEEEQEIQSIMATPATGSDSDDFDLPSPPFTFHGILPSSRILVSSFLGCHPSRKQAAELWQVFMRGVHPIRTAVHAPSAQVLMFTALNDLAGTRPDVHALLFGVYFLSATILTTNGVETVLGVDKQSALQRFKAGFEMALAAANVIETPTLSAIQGVAIFLQACRAHSTGRSIWFYNGMAIRLAQSMGLHRDGSNFNMSPFDAEIRRRLWWLLVSHDTRAGEDYGLDGFTMDPTADTQLPKTVDDAALDPSMTELPTPPPRWTEMTMSSIIFGKARAKHKLNQIRVLPDAYSPAGLARQQQVLDEAERHYEQEVQFCNPVVPIQQQTILLGRLLHLKLAFITRVQWWHIAEGHRQPLYAKEGQGQRPQSQSSPPGPITGVPSSTTAKESEGSPRTSYSFTDKALSEALDILDLNFELLSDGEFDTPPDALPNLLWSTDLYPQYHVILYTLWYMCIQPETPLATRAWIAVNRFFEMEYSKNLRQGSSAAHNATFQVLDALRNKATARAAAVGVVPRSDYSAPTADPSAGTSASGGVKSASIEQVGHQEHLQGARAHSFTNTIPGRVGPGAGQEPNISTTSGGNDNLDTFMSGNFIGKMGWETGFVDWDSLVEDLSAQSYEMSK